MWLPFKLIKRTKSKDEYNKLDKAGVICNFIIGIVCSIIFLILLFAWAMAFGGTGTMLDSLIPTLHITIAISLIASALLRRRGYSKFSFIVQFIPVIEIIGIILYAIYEIFMNSL